MHTGEPSGNCKRGSTAGDSPRSKDIPKFTKVKVEAGEKAASPSQATIDLCGSDSGDSSVKFLQERAPSQRVLSSASGNVGDVYYSDSLLSAAGRDFFPFSPPLSPGGVHSIKEISGLGRSTSDIPSGRYGVGRGSGVHSGSVAVVGGPFTKSLSEPVPVQKKRLEGCRPAFQMPEPKIDPQGGDMPAEQHMHEEEPLLSQNLLFGHPDPTESSQVSSGQTVHSDSTRSATLDSDSTRSADSHQSVYSDISTSEQLPIMSDKDPVFVPEKVGGASRRQSPYYTRSQARKLAYQQTCDMQKDLQQAGCFSQETGSSGASATTGDHAKHCYGTSEKQAGGMDTPEHTEGMGTGTPEGKLGGGADYGDKSFGSGASSLAAPEDWFSFAAPPLRSPTQPEMPAFNSANSTQGTPGIVASLCAESAVSYYSSPACRAAEALGSLEKIRLSSFTPKTRENLQEVRQRLDESLTDTFKEYKEQKIQSASLSSTEKDISEREAKLASLQHDTASCEAELEEKRSEIARIRSDHEQDVQSRDDAFRKEIAKFREDQTVEMEDELRLLAKRYVGIRSDESIQSIIADKRTQRLVELECSIIDQEDKHRKSLQKSETLLREAVASLDSEADELRENLASAEDRVSTQDKMVGYAKFRRSSVARSLQYSAEYQMDSEFDVKRHSLEMRRIRDKASLRQSTGSVFTPVGALVPPAKPTPDTSNLSVSTSGQSRRSIRNSLDTLPFGSLSPAHSPDSDTVPFPSRFNGDTSGDEDSSGVLLQLGDNLDVSGGKGAVDSQVIP